MIMTTTQQLHTQVRIFCGDCDNLVNTELKTLTDLNFNILVDTQMKLLLQKTPTRQDRLFQAVE